MWQCILFVVAFAVLLVIIEAERMKDCPACQGEDDNCSECGGDTREQA